MLNNGYQSVQELRNDRNQWARQCFSRVAHQSSGGQASELASAIYQRLAYSAPRLSPLDQLADKLALPKSERELLWLLACCELDSALATLLRRDHERPALPTNLARRLLQVSAGAASVVEKSAIRRLYADGLLESTSDHRLRLASRVLQLVTRDPASGDAACERPATGPMIQARNRYPRGTTQPGWAATPDGLPANVTAATLAPAASAASAVPKVVAAAVAFIDEDSAWLANLRRDPTAANHIGSEGLLCVGISRVR